MPSLTEALRGASAVDRDSHRAVFFRTARPDDRAALGELLRHRPHLLVADHLHAQLTELVKALNPAVKFLAADLDAAAIAHLGATPAEEYGVWVHYPWSNRLVHLLDEAEFALVRTDRNRNKITREEQTRLATKRVGVIGLSVGQSVSLTMAQERSFGELRLADFDTLELSNLNRIRSGVHQLGVNKVINTAREIAEIDPYLRVTCFTEGISEANIEQFLTDGGPLDLLVEECDSVAVKIIARQKAKALRIPVLMDTSDRGLIDVERFDLEPDRPILHGLVDHLDLTLAAKAKTNEEKLPFVVPIIGLETMSTRMKASMLEIESSVGTWPQLGSAVAMGGAIIAHAGRSILLGHQQPSGRWWIDPDDLLVSGDRRQHPATEVQPEVVAIATQATLDLDEMIQAADAFAQNEVDLEFSVAEAELLASAGCLAPTGGNSQPWRFLHHEGRMFVFLDGERARSSLDPGSRYAYLGMGACVENMVLQAAKHSMAVEVAFAPLERFPQLIAVMTKKTAAASTIDPSAAVLADQIEQRCTNRRYYRANEPMEQELAALSQAMAGDPRVVITLVSEKENIDHIASLCGKAERIRFLNPTCHEDMFVREMRWSAEEAAQTKDGIDVATLELSITDRTGLSVAADKRAVALLREWKTGRGMEKLASKSVRASSAIVVLSIPDLSLKCAFEGGRALQRLWLKASALGISAQPISAPIFMGIHGLWDHQGVLSLEEHEEAASVLDELHGLLGDLNAKPFFMMRLGKAEQPSERSQRLPLHIVFHSTVPVPVVAR